MTFYRFSRCVTRCALNRRHSSLTSTFQRHVRHCNSHATDKNSLQYISMYNYTPIDEAKLPIVRKSLHDRWSELNVLGRVYLAQEGINAQVILPTKHIDAFATSFPTLFQPSMLNYGANYTIGSSQDAQNKSLALFKSLDIRIRHQIVADGFNKGQLNLQESGQSLSPQQWHQKLIDREQQENPGETLVLDVRNHYEHEIGRFEGATRIMVDTFRDTFDAVDEILDDYKTNHGSPPSHVMMYCTGGIRCEKVGAYLKQYQGIDHIDKLQGGIVHYQRFIKNHPSPINSLFKGKNFVFDQRCVTEDSTGDQTLTDDVLGKCFQCGAPCNVHINCHNLMCHGLILQCAQCNDQWLGTCSEACRDQVVIMDKMTIEEQRLYRKKHAEEWKSKIPNAMSDMKYVKFRPIPPSFKQH